MKNQCPCGGYSSYSNCCEKYHLNKEVAETAEKLMRSRYSAFVKKEEGYLLSTWHASTRPKNVNLKKQVIKWTKLNVLKVKNGLEDCKDGTVEFIAEYRAGVQHGKLHEISSFVKEDGRWFYVDGEVLEA